MLKFNEWIGRWLRLAESIGKVIELSAKLSATYNLKQLVKWVGA